MAGEKCKSSYFYQVLASVIYLSLCKVTQAMPFELLRLRRMPSTQENRRTPRQVIRLPVSQQGMTRRFCRNTPAKTGLKPWAGSIQVVLGWEARTSMFYFPYRSVAKFPGKNNAVSLHTSGIKLNAAKRMLLFCRQWAKNELNIISQTL